MNQFQKTFDDIVELTRAKPIGTEGSFSGLCPSHDDKSPSLSITLENERILLYCHTGCTIERICSSLGIEKYDLFAPGDEKQINRTPASQKAESDQKRMKANINADGKVVFVVADGNVVFVEKFVEGAAIERGGDMSSWMACTVLCLCSHNLRALQISLVHFLLIFRLHVPCSSLRPYQSTMWSWMGVSH